MTAEHAVDETNAQKQTSRMFCIEEFLAYCLALTCTLFIL